MRMSSEKGETGNAELERGAGDNGGVSGNESPRMPPEGKSPGGIGTPGTANLPIGVVRQNLPPKVTETKSFSPRHIREGQKARFLFSVAVFSSTRKG